MKKHSLAMVFLLILTLCLVSAVSASDNVTLSESQAVPESQGEIEMDLTDNYEIYEDNLELSFEDDFENPVSSDNSEIQTRSIDANYELGYEITTDFASSVDIESSDDVLVISNAGFFKINNQTTENVLNGIVDASNGYITYEDGNLFTVSSNVDSVFVMFFYKNDESLTIALYNESTTPLYYGNAGLEMSASLLDEVIADGEFKNSWSDILESWTNGRLDDLNLLAYHRYVPFGLLSEINTLQTAKTYPHEFNLPLADMLGVSWDFDDDAFILGKANSSDEKASVAVNMVSKSMEESSSLNLYDVGVDATNKALSYFKSQNVDIPKDYPYLYVLTSAGHVKVNGQKTDKALKGILDALGSKFDSKHLISVDDPSWKDLVFYFIVVKGTKHLSYALKYDSDLSKLVKSSKVKRMGDKMVKDKGLYSTSRGHYHPVIKKIRHEVISNVSHADLNQTVKQNVTDHKNTTSGNDSNVTAKENKSDEKVEIPVKNNGNPFSFVYTLAAILIVCVIFGSGYRKR